MTEQSRPENEFERIEYAARIDEYKQELAAID